MMTLNQIFMEEAYGKEYVEFQSIKESLERNYDKENDIFHASGRIKDLTQYLNLSEADERTITHLCSKCETVESRLFNEDAMSSNYKTIMAMSITEDYNKLIESTNKRGTYEKLPSKEAYAKIAAATKYFVESYLMDKHDCVFKDSKSLQFNSLINEEYRNIEQVL